MRIRTAVPVLLCCFLLLALGSLSPYLHAQERPGNLTSYALSERSVTLVADTMRVRLTFYTAAIVRVDFLPSPSSMLDSSFVIIQDTMVIPRSRVVDQDSLLLISADSLSVVCTKKPLRLRFLDAAGKQLLADAPQGGCSSNFNERNVEFAIVPGEHYYGTGERGTAIDKRGQAFDSYNTQIGGYGSALPTMNINVPFVATSNGYGIYFENTYPGRFDFGNYDPSIFSYSASGGELSYFVIAGATVPEQLERYTWLTGRQPLPPRWAFGYIQSKYGYRNETEARTMIQTMRQKQIPCDAIVLDLYWFTQMGDLSWSPSFSSNPFQMMSDFLALGFKTIVITEPYITSSSLNFAEASAQGHLGRMMGGPPYLLGNWWSCNCTAGLLDITKPAARDWWWSKHPAFFGSQLAGIWTDLGEPERHPQDMQHYLGSASKVHNIYDLLWAKTIFEGFHQLRPDERLFNLTRSGYAGIQRYGAVPWSGDVGRTFGGLAVQLPILLSQGVSGLAYQNSDIGGFQGDLNSPELYARWMQFGTFCPITRAHGSGRDTEPWTYGSEVEQISRRYIQLRYTLLPYIYTLARENTVKGMPLARPLFFEETANPMFSSESGTYLWGNAFLVSPVVQQGMTCKQVPLPGGHWFDFWTDAVYGGGQTVTVPAPLQTMPLFVRAGSVIPMQPVMQYTDERPLDTLMLAVYAYPGTQDAFTLYEDDGKSLAYQSGAYAQTLLSQQTLPGPSAAVSVAIGAATGQYAGKPARRTWVADIHGIYSAPSAVTVNGITLSARTSRDVLRTNSDGFFYDSSAHLLSVQIVTVPESSYVILAELVRFTGVNEEPQQPSEFELRQNWPNPFNPVTQINYTIGQEKDFGTIPKGPLFGVGLGEGGRNVLVQLVVYDMLGREVKTLVNKPQAPGYYQVRFEGTNLASGMYFCRLRAGSFLETRRMMLLR